MPKKTPSIKRRVSGKTDNTDLSVVGTSYDALIPSEYPKLKVVEAITAYLTTGSQSKVQALTGVSNPEFSGWMSQPWYPEVVQAIRQRQQDALDGRLSGLMDTALNVVEERLQNGDPRLTKDGDVVYIPVSAASATKVMGTLYEKRALIRGDATSHKVVEDGGLNKLAQMLEKIAKEKAIERVIPGERIE